MSRKTDETNIVKQALKELGYRVKVKHGIGTGSGWIKAYIPKSVWEQDRQKVEQMIASATGRHSIDNNYILVQWYE